MKTMLRLAIITLICVTFIGGLWIATPPTEARGGSWTVTVFSNPNLAGSPNYVGVAPSVNYTWGTGAPVINGVDTAPYGVPVDNFSVRFTTSAFFTAGNYRFTVQVDDGARLYVDGLLLINQWVAGGFRTYQADFIASTDGNHTITVEMFDSTGDATIIANWALSVGPLPTATTTCVGVPWYAQFYNGLDLSGGVIFSTTYGPSGLSQNWGQGSPGGTVPVDNFSASFTRTLNVPTDMPQGVYTFYAKADDNFRFTIDSTVIIDKWDTFAGDLQTAEATLLNGPHTFKFDYRERTVDASLFLTWTPPNAQCPVLNPEGGTGGGTGGGGGQPTGITATVNIASLNFRSAPSTTAQILSKLSKGQVYPATGRTADNAWVQLSVGGVSGWVSAQYVTLSGDINTLPVVSGGEGGGAPPPPQPTGVRGRVMGNLRVRAAPTVHSARVALMPWGTEVDILGIDQGRTWYQVNYNGMVGWSYAPWIRIIQGSFDALPYTDGTQPAFEPPPATQGVVVQAYGNMRIRSGPGFQYPKVARAVWGSRLQVLGRSSSGLWYKVKYGDTVGFSFASWYRVVQGDISSVPIADQ
jgi:uncharacterized protein YraI